MGIFTINSDKLVKPKFIKIDLGTDVTTSTKACSNFGYGNVNSYYIVSSETFATATMLYTDLGVTLAAAGWYSDGNIAREWDGNQFINTVPCQSTVTAVTLGDNLTNSDACAEYQKNPTTYYILSGETFLTTTLLYQDSNGTVLASAGIYSDGTNYRTWDGAQFSGNSGSCNV